MSFFSSRVDLVKLSSLSPARSGLPDTMDSVPEERIAKGKPEAGTVTLTAENVGGEIVIPPG